MALSGVSIFIFDWEGSNVFRQKENVVLVNLWYRLSMLLLLSKVNVILLMLLRTVPTNTEVFLRGL